MLRKRGADPRASWAFNPDDLTGVAGEGKRFIFNIKVCSKITFRPCEKYLDNPFNLCADGDLISAVKSAQSEAANSLERGELSAHVSPTAADSDAHLSLEENSGKSHFNTQLFVCAFIHS